MRMQRSLARPDLILSGLVTRSPVYLIVLPVRSSMIPTPRSGWARRGWRRLLVVFARFCASGAGQTSTQ